MKIGTRQKRTLYIGAAVVALAALIYALTLQQPAADDVSGTVALKKEMLLKQRETLLREGIYEVQLQQYQKRFQDDRARLLPGENPNIAGAELLNVIRDFADKSGVEITQTQTLREENVGDRLVKISAPIRINCNMKQLVQFLAEIENHDKFLTVDSLSIMSRNQRNPGMQPNLTISGYIYSRENKPEEPARDTKL